MFNLKSNDYELKCFVVSFGLDMFFSVQLQFGSDFFNDLFDKHVFSSPKITAKSELTKNSPDKKHSTGRVENLKKLFWVDRWISYFSLWPFAFSETHV